ncbi:S8 family peptidase [Halioglobus maricola]|nr:S8 family peptidase [Halioglobus maricola]
MAHTRAILTAAIAATSLCTSASEEHLHVMLQGESASAMADLVQAQGGELTHKLPVIDAVGAQLSRAQLDAILTSDEVLRHIDDLAFDPPDDNRPERTSCDVGGYLQLQFDELGLEWQLLNKTDKAVRASQLTLDWPHEWGAATMLSLGDTQWTGSQLPSAPGGLTLNFTGDKAPALRGSGHLKVRFANSSKRPGPERQNLFSSEITFGPDCTLSSPPAYPDNHNDFYYATVTGADNLHRHHIRGQGVTVAMLDSGLWEHDSLALDTSGAPRVVARYDAISGHEVNEAFDESGHGSHLTSVLAHSGPTLRDGKATGTYKGIAPDVKLAVIKAFNVEGQGGMLDIVRGVQWAIDNQAKHNIRVLNLSFASRPRWPYFLDPVNQAVMRAWQAGIVVVAAAGNEGPEPMSVGSPGNLPYIITVGAVTDSWTPLDRSDDYVPDFSSRGPTPSAHIKPDIVAPGGHMTGLTRPGSSLTTDHPEYLLDTGEFVMTGSSQAAALVSGLVALLLQLEPQLTPDNVKCMLTSSADPAINRDGLLAYSPFEQGQGYVSVTRALTLGARDCANEGLNLEHDISGKDHFEGPAVMSEDGEITLPGLEQMLSPAPPAKGASDIRTWGVKAHIERLPPGASDSPDSPFNWEQLYQIEKKRMEEIGN